MTALDHDAANRALTLLDAARGEASQAEECVLVAKMRFIIKARQAGWSWETIGAKLDQSGTAVRRYYNRNKLRVRAGALAA